MTQTKLNATLKAKNSEGCLGSFFSQKFPGLFFLALLYRSLTTQQGNNKWAPWGGKELHVLFLCPCIATTLNFQPCPGVLSPPLFFACPFCNISSHCSWSVHRINFTGKMRGRFPFAFCAGIRIVSQKMVKVEYKLGTSPFVFLKPACRNEIICLPHDNNNMGSITYHKWPTKLPRFIRLVDKWWDFLYATKYACLFPLHSKATQHIIIFLIFIIWPGELEAYSLPSTERLELTRSNQGYWGENKIE